MPTNEPPDVNVNEPFGARLTDPLPLSLTLVAVNASPSASVSLARTPGAGTLSVTPVTAVYESSWATGAALVTVMVTVVVLVRRPESRYLN